MIVTYGDHAYSYDHGDKILLKSIKHLSCGCGAAQVEFPRIAQLHRTIETAIRCYKRQGVRRQDLAFVFEYGEKGVEDGSWAVLIRQPQVTP